MAEPYEMKSKYARSDCGSRDGKSADEGGFQNERQSGHRSPAARLMGARRQVSMQDRWYDRPHVVQNVWSRLWESKERQIVCSRAHRQLALRHPLRCNALGWRSSGVSSFSWQIRQSSLLCFFSWKKMRRNLDEEPHRSISSLRSSMCTYVLGIFLYCC